MPVWLKFTTAVPLPPLTWEACRDPTLAPVPRLSVPDDAVSKPIVTFPVPPLTTTLPPVRLSVPVAVGSSPMVM